MNIALLMTEENIVGRELLDQLAKRRLCPSLVVIEKSERAEREKSYLKNDFYNPPAIQDLFPLFDAEFFEVSNLNQEDSRKKLLQHSPGIILLDGSVIIKPHIFSLAKIGTINSHPGLLPEYRGVDSVRWSIYHGKPVGATAHFVDNGLDTGPILVKEKIDLQKGEDILRLRVRVMRVCAKIAVQAAQGLLDATLIPQTQPKEGGYYSWAPVEIREKVDEILRGL